MDPRDRQVRRAEEAPSNLSRNQSLGIFPCFDPLGSPEGWDPGAQVIKIEGVETIDHSLQVMQKPLRIFDGDIAIGASANRVIDCQTPFIQGYADGFNILNVVGTVQLAINGGGLRTQPAGITAGLGGAMVKTLRVVTGAASGCIIQLNGT